MNTLIKIENQLLDGADFEHNFIDFKEKRKIYLENPSPKNWVELKMSASKVCEDIKLCKVGHYISIEDYYEMIEYICNIENEF